jgi:hypothetical protein
MQGLLWLSVILFFVCTAAGMFVIPVYVNVARGVSYARAASATRRRSRT